MKRKSLYLSILMAIIFAACAKVAFTGRSQFRALPESELVSMSLVEYQQFLQQNKLSTNTSQVAMIREVGYNLQRAIEHYYAANGLTSELKGFNWEYNLVEDKQTNAWCMPGGKVVIYTGILPVVQNTDALAILMGHEMAHALAYHGNERMSQMLIAQLGGIALDVATREKPEQTRQLLQIAYGVGTQVGALLPFSRKHESEADEIGLYLAAIAGYNVHEAPTFWQRMQANGGGGVPEFLSTHPDPGKRSSRLQSLAAKGEEYRLKYGSAPKRQRQTF